MNIPNLLTVLRVLLIPVFILLFYLPFDWSYWAASGIFALAAVTDWFDGYLARRLEQSTPFGAFLDPVADKLMVAVALVLLVEEHANIWLTLPAAIIIGREIVVSALREWMAELGERVFHRVGAYWLRPAVRCRGSDPVVHVPVPAGRLAAPASDPGKEISFLNQRLDGSIGNDRMAAVTKRE